MKTKLKELDRLIGNTPMIGINYRYKGKKGVVYAKCEYYNFSGSIKDRMALYILKEAYKNGAITPNSIIVEATSGNTGIAFSALGRMLGHKVRIIMPDWMSQERKMLIKSFGAEIIPVSKEEGGFLGSIRLSEEMAAKDPNVFLPRQFSNCNNKAAMPSSQCVCGGSRHGRHHRRGWKSVACCLRKHHDTSLGTGRKPNVNDRL